VGGGGGWGGGGGVGGGVVISEAKGGGRVVQKSFPRRVDPLGCEKKYAGESLRPAHVSGKEGKRPPNNRG